MESQHQLPLGEDEHHRWRGSLARWAEIRVTAAGTGSDLRMEFNLQFARVLVGMSRPETERHVTMA